MSTLQYCDSHCHLDDARYDDDRNDIIDLLSNRMRTCINVGSSVASSERSVALANAHSFLYATAGIHPHHANEYRDSDLSAIARLVKSPKVVALGEIGLDYHYDNTVKTNQQRMFRQQLELAREVGLPVVIHTRDASADTMAILREHAAAADYVNPELRERKGVLHCFSGNLTMATEAVGLGFYISLAGPLTYPKSPKLTEVASHIPITRLLIETDSPYLPPEPYRGKRNNPSYVAYVARRLAEIRGMSEEAIARTTYENAKTLFGFK